MKSDSRESSCGLFNSAEKKPPNGANNDGVRISEDRVMDRPTYTQTIFPDKLIKNKRNSISKCF